MPLSDPPVLVLLRKCFGAVVSVFRLLFEVCGHWPHQVTVTRTVSDYSRLSAVVGKVVLQPIVVTTAVVRLCFLEQYEVHCNNGSATKILFWLSHIFTNSAS